MRHSQNPPQWADASPQEHLEWALGVTKKYSVQNLTPEGNIFQWKHQKTINWDDYAMAARQDMASVSKPDQEDLCGVLDRALLRLADSHSLVIARGIYSRANYSLFNLQNGYWDQSALRVSWGEQKATRLEGARSIVQHYKPKLSYPLSHWVLPDVPLVSTPAFLYGRMDKDKYLGRLQRAFNSMTGRPLRGLVLDARAIEGSMVPPVYGLAPVLGPGPRGYFSSPDSCEPWHVNYGAFGFGWPDHSSRVQDYPLLSMPVAVMQGPMNGSAGEIVALSFRGRTEGPTRSFGAATAGLSTGNVVFNVTDKIAFALCTSVSQDRNHVGEGSPLLPDVHTDKPLHEAVRWLQTFPAKTYG